MNKEINFNRKEFNKSNYEIKNNYDDFKKEIKKVKKKNDNFFPITISKKGYPVMWEKGGSYSEEKGEIQMIGDGNGEPKPFIFKNPSKNKICGNQVLLPISKGDIVIQASHENKDITLYVYRISNISKIQKKAFYKLINTYENNEWYKNLDPKLEEITNIAMEKVIDTKCDSGYFYKEPYNY